MENKNKRTVKVFGSASFLNDVGSDMIAPIWPLFVLSLGADMRILGLIDGLGEAVVSISQAASGYLSDKIGRRKVFVWTGYLLGSMSRLGYALTTAWIYLVPFKILDRFGKIRDCPRDALIADSVETKERGQSFGFLRMMDHAGAFTGVLVTMILIGYIEIKEIILLAAIPSIISALLIYLFIKEKKSDKLCVSFSFRNLSENFKSFLLAGSIFALASFSYSFLIVYADMNGVEKIYVPALYLLFTLFASLSSVPFGRLADRVGRKLAVQISFLLFLCMCAAALTSSVFSVILVFILYGLHRGAFETIQRTFVSELSDERYRASSLGVYQMVTGLLALPSSLFAGILWETVSWQAPFIFSGALALISTLLIQRVKETLN